MMGLKKPVLRIFLKMILMPDPSGRIQYYTGAKNPEVGHRLGGEVRPE